MLFFPSFSAELEISEDGNAEKQINLAFDFLEGEPESYERCMFWGVNRHNEEEHDRPGDNSDDEVRFMNILLHVMAEKFTMGSF